MPEIMPFGKRKDWTVEQILLRDCDYFYYILKNIPLKKDSLRYRFEFVDRVANNFVSQNNCAYCQEHPARKISIYHNYQMGIRTSSKGFIYCSNNCFNQDPSVTDQRNKVTLENLGFMTAISSTKFDTNELTKIMSECMGLSPGRKTKEYLEDFFDRCPTW